MKEIPLTQGQVALVDDQDFDRLSQFKWFARKVKGSRTFYAARWEPRSDRKRRHIHMHHVVFGSRIKLDHQDGNGLNNTRRNLRTCTHSQNCSNGAKRKNNSSGFKGVYPNRGRWMAAISDGVRFKNLGRFEDPVLAAQAYDKAALKHFGDFARLNFPDRSRMVSLS